MSSNNDVIFIDDNPRYDDVSLTLTSGNNLFPDGGLHSNGEPSFTGTVSLTTSTLPDPLDSYSNVVNADFIAPEQDNKKKFKMYPSQWVFVTFQKEGLHRWPDAYKYPGIEFLANEHRHMFHFRVEIQVFHDDREVEFILFKRELEGQYESGALELNHKSCEMMADDLAKYITDHYPGRFLKIEVSEDGENGAVMYYSGDLK